MRIGKHFAPWAVVVAVGATLCGCARDAATPADATTLADGAHAWPAPSSTLTPVQKRVLAEVVKLATLDHDVAVYGLPEPVTAGAEILPAEAPAGSPPVALSEPTWLFFIDDAPHALFGHAVRYVTVGATSGTLATVAANSWPVRGGQPVFGEGDAGAPSPYLVYSSQAVASEPKPPPRPPQPPPRPPQQPPPPPPPPNCPDGQPAKRFALLIQGSGAHAHVMKNTVDAVRTALVAAGGFAIQEANAATVKGMAKQIGDAVAAMAGSMRCCDEVFVYLNGHGHRLVEAKDAKGKPTGDWLRVDEHGTVVGSGGGALAGYPKVPPNTPSRWQFFIAPGEFMPADALFALLAGLKSCHVTLVVESCFSGALIDEAQQRVRTERLLTSQNRVALSPTDDGTGAQAPATAAMLGKLALKSDVDLGQQVADAFAAGASANKFKGSGTDPRASGNTSAYASGQTSKDGKTTWQAFPQSYQRSDQETPCPCCRDGKLDPGEQCDPGPPAAVACKATDQLCLNDCSCAVCSKAKDGTVQTESAPGKACTGTPVKTSFAVAPNADGTHKLHASLAATFTSATQSGMFVRLLRADGSKLYVGAIGKQYSAFLLAANGKKLATYPCTGAQVTTPAGPGWDVTADPIPAAALQGVTEVRIEVTDGNCSGSLDVGLATGPGCPW